MRERTRPEQLHVELNAKERETLDLEQDNKPEGYFFISCFSSEFYRVSFGLASQLLGFLALLSWGFLASWLLGFLASVFLALLFVAFVAMAFRILSVLVGGFLPMFLCRAVVWLCDGVLHEKTRTVPQNWLCFLEIGSVPQFSLELIVFSSKLVVFPGNLWCVFLKK